MLVLNTTKMKDLGVLERKRAKEVITIVGITVAYYA